ncbi:MAG: ATP-dependent DNA helicase [Armatimonadota bacterium]
MSLLDSGSPVVFVTGKAGTGKSTLIRYLRKVLTKRLAVVAPTGVAAINAGGATIHSMFRLPPKIHEDKDIKRVYGRKLYQKLELLIVDEVSMVRADLMDSVDCFLRKNRESPHPFGGVQLLLIGDLFQLPPVVTEQEREVLIRKGYTVFYFFDAFSLKRAPISFVELPKVFRQTDEDFINILNCIRAGEDVDDAVVELNARCFRPDTDPTDLDLILTCTNAKADEINQRELDQLPTKARVFQGRITGEFSIKDDKLPSPMDLTLKIGARVMFTKNDEQHRWVNGTIGVVRDMDQNSVTVELLGEHRGSVHNVQAVTWETYRYEYDEENDNIVARKVGEDIQYPLMLSWAVTIHKSQGKTLNNVFVDLGDGAFAPGQVYVALSRCRTLDGIRLARPIRPSEVKCDPVVTRFYRELQAS